jgi:hypothetical protein
MDAGAPAGIAMPSSGADRSTSTPRRWLLPGRTAWGALQAAPDDLGKTPTARATDRAAESSRDSFLRH